jgi:hypothetical protein
MLPAMTGGSARGTWCLVSGPDYYQQIPEELQRNGGRLTWSAPRDLVVGDLALLYQSSPSSEFAWLFRACSDAVPEERWGHMAWFEVLRFERGVAFAEAARDPTISDWPKMRARLVGSNHAVPAAAWDRLLEFLLERNPSTRSAVEEWTRTRPSPEDRQLEDFAGADSYGFEPLFERESEFEEAVLNAFVESGVARLPDSADSLPLKGRQDRISTALRSDLVLVEVAEGAEQQPSLVVIELKLWARSVANVRQLEGYVDRLDEIVPDRWEIGAALVAQGFSQAVLEQAGAAGIQCWIAQPIDDADFGWELVPVGE